MIFWLNYNHYNNYNHDIVRDNDYNPMRGVFKY